MAQPSNTYDSYDNANSIKEDIQDIIYNISPDEVPFMSKSQKTTAKSTLHEWSTDTLRSSAANAHIEGDDTTATAVTGVTRLNNRCQIFKDAIIVSDTDQGLSKIAKDKEMSYQILKAGKAMKLDIEKALFDNNAKVTGSSTAARELAGAPTWLTSNTVAGSGGSDATGDGTDARTDGTQAAFTQANFDTVMQGIWENGGTGIKSCYLSAFQMNKALAFTGNNNQRANVVGADERVINSVSIYLTPFGEVSFTPSRENRSRDVFIMQDDTWQVATLRPMKNVELSKTGDNSKRQLTTELTLVCKSEAANGMVADCTTS